MSSSQFHNQGRESQCYSPAQYSQNSFNHNYDYVHKNPNYITQEVIQYQNVEYPNASLEKVIYHKANNFSNSQVIVSLSKISHVDIGME